MKPFNQPSLAKAVLGGLAAWVGSGLDDLPAQSATPQRVTGRYKHNRGPFTRNRKTRGRNPKKRLRQELRAMRKRLKNDPNLNTYQSLYLAVAIERAQRRRQAVAYIGGICHSADYAHGRISDQTRTDGRISYMLYCMDRKPESLKALRSGRPNNMTKFVVRQNLQSLRNCMAEIHRLEAA